MKSINIFILFLLIQFSLIISVSAGDDVNFVKNIDVQVENSNIVVKIITDFIPDYRYFCLEAGEFPFKVVVDVKNARLINSRVIDVNEGLVKRIRVGQWFTNPDIVRIIVDLSGKVGYNIEPIEEGISIRIPYSKELAGQNVEMMNYRNISIIDLLRVFSEIYNLNFVISKDVNESDPVTVRLQNVPFEDALDAILTANEYNYIRKNGIILVKNHENKLMGDIETEIFQLRYINAGDIIENLRNIITPVIGNIEMFVKSPIGNVEVTLPTLEGGMEAGAGLPEMDASAQTHSVTGAPADAVPTQRSNVLIVTDYPEVIERIGKIIKEIDIPSKQVRIEVKLIETEFDNKDKWGINWTAGEEVSPQGVSGIQVPAKPLKVKSFQFGSLSLSQYKAILHLLEKRGNSRLLIMPSISVLDNQQANIAVGTIVPIDAYQPLMGSGADVEKTGMKGGTAGKQQFTSISLTVVPHVNDDRYVTLWVQPTINEITSYTGKYGELPVTSTRTANSQVRVKDGDTVIIDGLIKEDKVKTTKRVKFLSKIPLLGKLFTFSSIETVRNELVIFVTPYIIEEENLASEKTIDANVN